MAEPIRLTDVRCPACGRLLFRARPADGAHAEIKCTCRRIVVIRQGINPTVTDRVA